MDILIFLERFGDFFLKVFAWIGQTIVLLAIILFGIIFGVKVIFPNDQNVQLEIGGVAFAVDISILIGLGYLAEIIGHRSRHLMLVAMTIEKIPIVRHLFIRRLILQGIVKEE